MELFTKRELHFRCPEKRRKLTLSKLESIAVADPIKVIIS
jgi:hypothetical protein